MEPDMKHAAEVLWVARYDYKQNWVLRRHIHNYYQAILIVYGKGSFSLGQEEYTISPDTLFLIKPGCEHGLVNGSEGILKTLDIKFFLHDSELCGMLNKARNVYPGLDSSFRIIFENIRNEGIHRRPFFKDMSREHLLQMLYMLLRYDCEKYSSDKKPEDIVIQDHCDAGDKIKEYIRNHYMEDVSLKLISEELGYNISYICQIFKKNHNITPMKYLYHYRVEKACELMVYSDYSLKQISEMTGFKSIHHFSRTFRKQKGMSPGQFYRREREGIRKDVYINDNFDNTVSTYIE
jgi:AraC-like DNA-binding protein